MRCKSLGMLWVFIVLYQPLITNYNYATKTISTIVTFNFHVLDKKFLCIISVGYISPRYLLQYRT